MSLLPSRAARSLCALLALLLLTPPGPLASGESSQPAGRTGQSSTPQPLQRPPPGPSAVVVRELRCVCLTIKPTINPKMISNLQVIAAGPQCPKVELIATLKNGKDVCLDPEVPLIKKIIQKLLDRSDVTSSCASSLHVLQVLLLLLSLLLAMMVPPTMGKTKSVDYEWYTELLCTCVKIISGIHPSNIQNLKVISPGHHCPKVEVM
ncbi:Alveolar macrophage chemotactic factor 2 [Pteropus alecto]|uniref:C-X-C motif chemokine n=1 Tax=Pteropus alecto TaxID=9402 RepID=L5KB92_PTEAL|nr:Alveolar macrophage chemotactic factor 2 [Pteropus alecto]